MTATRAPDGVRSVPSREEHDRSEGRIAFPLRVGVTGHRDLHDPAAVRKAVRTELSKLRDLFPETAVTTVRFTLLSSLAEGADRLVLDEAREALPEHRLVLHAVLPMERDEYRKDFATDACREDFDRLLDGAAQITTLPATADRDQAYEHAGTWIVEHSDAVIAVWDGRPAAGRGGTAEIARHARVQGVPVIVVPAARDGDPQRAPHPVAWATDVAGVPLDAAREAYARTDEFNRGSVRDNRLRGPIDRLETQLSGAAEGSAVHWLYEIVAEWALPRLARADMLAMRYQRRYYRLGEALYAFAALAVTAIAFQ